MTLTRAFALLSFLVAASLPAQEPPSAKTRTQDQFERFLQAYQGREEALPAKALGQEPLALKVIPVRYADVKRVEQILKLFGYARADSELRVVAVSGSPAAVAAMEEAVRRLDVPPAPQRNVELTFHVLEASKEPSAEKLPAELDPVVRQLKSLFAYQGFRLVDTLFVRARDGQSVLATSGTLDAVAKGPFQNAVLEVHSPRVEITGREAPSSVRLSRLSFHIRPHPTSHNIAKIDTSIDVVEGQKAVIGKASVPGMESAIILVVTAKVVD